MGHKKKEMNTKCNLISFDSWFKKDNDISTFEIYETLTPVWYETQYNTEYNNTTFLEKLEHNTMGI